MRNGIIGYPVRIKCVSDKALPAENGVSLVKANCITTHHFTNSFEKSVSALAINAVNVLYFSLIGFTDRYFTNDGSDISLIYVIKLVKM